MKSLNVKKLAETIFSAINDEYEYFPRGETWVPYIRCILEDICLNLGLHPIYEFLDIDICFLDNKHNIVFGCEYEYNPNKNSIEYALLKLRNIRAKIRCLIFQSDTKSIDYILNTSELKEYLEDGQWIIISLCSSKNKPNTCTYLYYNLQEKCQQKSKNKSHHVYRSEFFDYRKFVDYFEKILNDKIRYFTEWWKSWRFNICCILKHLGSRLGFHVELKEKKEEGECPAYVFWHGERETMAFDYIEDDSDNKEDLIREYNGLLKYSDPKDKIKTKCLIAWVGKKDIRKLEEEAKKILRQLERRDTNTHLLMFATEKDSVFVKVLC